jgi:DNA-binding GntR family transcriptional regulator
VTEEEIVGTPLAPVLNLAYLAKPGQQGEAVPAATAEPLYKKVADDLRDQIAKGRLGVGAKIPSIAKLSEQYGISKGTAQRAVGELKDEGLLMGQSGKAVSVVATPDDASAIKSVEEQLDELREDVGRLSEQHPEVITRIEELQVQVGRLQADLRHLYDRLGQPYPHGRSTPKPKRRTSGA